MLETRRPAFTLLELVVAIVLFSLVASVVTPLIMASTDAYAASRSLRSATESAAFAIDRIQRVIREAPASPGSPGLDIATADATTLLFANGNGFALVGETIELTTPEGTAPLHENTESLTIEFLAADGFTAEPDPALAHRVHVTLTLEGVTMSTVAYPRVNIGAAP